MGILSPNFKKEGAGVNKDETIKYGIKLFFQLLTEKFWILIRLNLLFILFCIPLVTIPASISAMISITMSLIQRKHVFLFSDFIEKFKENWKQSTIYFLGAGLFTAAAAFSLIVYYKMGQYNHAYLILLFASITIILLFSFSALYFYPLVTTVELPLKDLIKDSFFLGIVCIKTSICGVFSLGFIICFTILYFPLTFILLLTLTFSLTSFIVSFITFPCISKYILKSDNFNANQSIS